MKNVKFEGNLKKTIEMSNKKFNLSRAIIANIIGYIATFIFAAGMTFIILDFPTTFLPMLVLITFGIDTILCVLDIKKDIKKLNINKQKAQEQLISLVYSLQRENVCTNLNQLQNSKVEENKITSIVKDNDSKVKTTEISRDIYFLDNLDNIQVLKEKRSEIKTNGNTKQVNSLKLIEEQEKPDYVSNVEKVLVLKRKA